MNQIKRFTKLLLIAIFGLVFVYSFFIYYPYIFSKKIVGEIMDVQRLDVPMTIMTRSGGDMNPQVFSFAVSIRDSKSSEIFAASSEDRQWAVVKTGQCAEVKIFPYPPWNLDRAGYFNARLEKLYDCPAKTN